MLVINGYKSTYIYSGTDPVGIIVVVMIIPTKSYQLLDVHPIVPLNNQRQESLPEVRTRFFRISVNWNMFRQAGNF